MSSWYSSWFSGLPTFDFAVPSNIQRRFFSFLLRRTLGHFLKPGQLDLHQIDSQLGSGTVQVKDLELDGQAINQLLVGLPLSLYDGFISGVTARIPFPNPLSSTVGVHVQSLNLAFQITSEQSASPALPFFHSSSNLADSVVSVAETFIHNELTPREGATLRQTLRPSVDSSPPVDESENLPGGFGPFEYSPNAEEARKEPRGDVDPAGVSVFATLIERVLAKFEFSAVDTKVTLAFTLSLSEITYHTAPGLRSDANTGLQSASGGNNRDGQIRTVSISGLKVTSRDLRVVVSSPTVTSTLSPVSLTHSRESSPLHRSPSVEQLSRNSSSSSLDEDTQLMMSQSIAMLPPASASSSMYQSAVSTAHAHPAKVHIFPTPISAPDDVRRVPPRPRISVPCQDSVEDVLLSFGSQPIILSLQTPAHRLQPPEQILQAGGDHSANAEDFVRNKPEQDTFQLSVTVGTLACAFRSGHLRVLLDAVDACVPKPPTPPPVPLGEASSGPPCAALCLDANVYIRGIVIIALPEPATGEVLSLDTFYERPLLPPRLPRTYLRLSLDVLSLSFQFSTPSPDLSVSAVPRTPSSVNQSISAKMVVSDISLFAFHAVSSADDSQVAAPILITDPYLPMLHVARHYRPSLATEGPEDIKLPEFEVVDWTKAKFKRGSAKLSTWRLKNRVISGKAAKLHTPSQRSCDLPSSPNPFITSPLSEAEDKLPGPPAVEASGQLELPFPPKEISRAVDVKIAPVHLFFDLDMAFKDNLLLHFVENIASAAIFTPRKATDMKGSQVLRQQSLGELNEDDVDVEKDIQIQRIPPRAREREEERKRLEALVLEDLNLDMDYQRPGAPRLKSSRQPTTLLERKKTVPSEPGFNLRLTCPMIRVEMRGPPPPSCLPRSGCMVFDLRGLIISNDLPSTKPSLRFAEGSRSSPPRSSDNVFLNICLQEILAAYSPVGDNVAHTILTLGFLPTREIGPDTSTLLATETAPETLPLSVVLRRPNIAEKSTSNPSNRLSITVDIPLMNLVIDKGLFDGLQCWADDVAQLIGRSFSTPDSRSETTLSRNPSLIGSRYFTQSRRSGTHSSDESVVHKSGRQNTSETVIKFGAKEVFLRLIVPRDDDSRHARPLDVSALDVDALIELKPEGKDESVVTAGITDLRIADTSSEGGYVFLVQSPPRSFSSAPRPSVKSRITSLVVPESTAKESRIKLSLWGFTVHPPLDSSLGKDLAVFVKAPPGVFESVVPSECTRLTVGVVDVSVHLRTLGHPGGAVLHLGEAEFSTELVGDSSESAFKLWVSSSHLFLVDSIEDALELTGKTQSPNDISVEFWKNSGYALIAEVSHSQLVYRADNSVLPPITSVVVERVGLRICLCADTISALTSLITSMTRPSGDNADTSLSRSTSRTPTTIISNRKHDMTASLDEHAFRLIPEVGSTADMISDDLPANQDYLDASFGTAAGLRELRDDDLEDFDIEEQTGHSTPVMGQLGIVSNVGGETVRILKPFSFVEHYFNTISPDTTQDPASDTTLRIRIHDSDIVLLLHDGFDWPRTRKIIEKEVKEMRKKLARIRQLVATGQTQEPLDEATSTTLFNSIHIGLQQDLESMDPDTLIAAIDEELDDSAEIGTESSWQSLHPASPGRAQTVSARVHAKRLTRSKGPSIEIRLEGLNAEIDNHHPGETLVSRTLILARDLEILDHIKTSTWKKFLTDMRSDSRGNVRETDSNMVRVELLSVRPSPSHPAEEARLRAKILPLRLYVDQDALDFFKKFFAFQDPDSPSTPEDGKKNEEIYFQHAEVFPVDIKLDYKPRRVDYRALRDGRTIELMNFFHFDGAEMTLRHLTLHGITGWPRFFDTLNDLWTPDVKATQLVDVISGVSPIRSVVNVGSGVADLVLLPIAQYKKDGRIVRGVQKGTKAFVQSTAMEAIKLGARLATGTQVILEQAENVLGGQFEDSVTAEALQIPYENEYADGSDEELISRYAAQPAGLKEGVQTAYHSLQRNLLSAAQTILAVPMEIYERSGEEGAVRAVVRAVPIAVLKPMIGASEAVSKTLMGLHNTLDPNVRLENEAKYKHR
ncbi:hypothetical protein L210DRAFT_3527080 [Boletus edulis BED1]|uniref:Autophagy-related protein 2 n=1 Tax=Boletus edulis BED1 TaxID=1328754 RepID=A0AAD4C3A8_BOLED|nr:hypothetical protein L210DRAFT_3527080 [Boletus edulis BED1]